MNLQNLTPPSGPYRVEHEIGVGGMATVYLAHGIKQDRDAIKVLRQAGGNRLTSTGLSLGPGLHEPRAGRR